ncbi:Probable multidrug resistance ABC transporter ATP-binding/permease protein YheH [uncultured Roseburia sp.]|uniref:ABC transporter ATP-binding protein/permease n=1 Tax=Brotonthovivens ammoniilytica TaxID=2981725 RepID=A0ABT2TFE7_9FIRM|nr:ABC transporter ATP-binding protein [Brotonthovivens ammoniilytica]MCU6760909.1 ABC transporter ATP-binding protein/permease [Brotonthovivens ammoniilytica]SCI13102.1 Probable multidrug resistance ABC transporter ATP-binding/permease protein YheH [uncultured Roseburia sp.]
MNNGQNTSGMKKEARKSMMKTLGRLMKYVTGIYKFQFVIVVISILLAAVGQVIGIMEMRYLIDDYIVPFIGQDHPVMSELVTIILTMAAAYVVVIFFSYLYSRLMINIAQGTLKTIRDEMFKHMQSLPIRYFDTNAHGDLMSRYTNDTDTLRQMISQAIPQILSSVITMVSVFISMLMLSVPMTIIVVLMLILMLWITKNIGGKSARYFVEQQMSLGAVNGYIEEMMEGQKVIKVFNHEKESKEGFDRLNDKLCDHVIRANTFANILMPMLFQIGNLTYLVVAVIGAALSITGVAPITLGVLASFLTFTRSFTQPISQVSQQVSYIVMALAGAQRIFNLMDEEPEEDQGTVTLVRANVSDDGTITESEGRTGQWAWREVQDGKTIYTQLKGDVRFKDVNFGYNEDKMILKHMSLFAKPGQKIAFVGPTGAGKTTITNLINRFYDIQNGQILYDGIDIKKIRKYDLRRSLGIVLQDTHLFTGSIEDNIRYGRLDATHEDVVAAAKLANADFFIRHLPDGYDTIISGDGSNLSQGQRQLLAIARAAIANPPVLILDEATSSIDTRTEGIIQDGMDQLMKGRTVFVIAHRLSTVRNSEAIMVLEQGEIIERGSHDELIEQKGKYYQLYTGAFELS